VGLAAAMKELDQQENELAEMWRKVWPIEDDYQYVLWDIKIEAVEVVKEHLKRAGEQGNLSNQAKVASTKPNLQALAYRQHKSDQ
jgi:Zn-dependent M32 family carboxypeptidase